MNATEEKTKMEWIDEWIDDNGTKIDVDTEYDDMLSELGPVRIGSLEYDAACVLKEIDPIAYRCGFSDYVDSCDYHEGNEGYYSQDEYNQAVDAYDEYVDELEEEEEEEEKTEA